jgi:hypothetical protein
MPATWSTVPVKSMPALVAWLTATSRGVLPIHLASDDWWPLVTSSGIGASGSNREKIDIGQARHAG